MRVEYEVIAVGVVRMGPMHRPIELKTPAVEVPSGAPRGSYRDAHSLSKSLRARFQAAREKLRWRATVSKTFSCRRVAFRIVMTDV